MSFRLLFILLASSVSCLTGCVSRTIEPVYPPNVATSQNNDGLVTIRWSSQVGYNYRLAALDKNGRPRYDTKVYRGTGDIIEVQFMRDPRRPLPNYVVKPEKIDSR
jgi:hypothetical protein